MEEILDATGDQLVLEFAGRLPLSDAGLQPVSDLLRTCVRELLRLSKTLDIALAVVECHHRSTTKFSPRDTQINISPAARCASVSRRSR